MDKISIVHQELYTNPDHSDVLIAIIKLPRNEMFPSCLYQIVAYNLEDGSDLAGYGNVSSVERAKRIITSMKKSFDEAAVLTVVEEFGIALTIDICRKPDDDIRVLASEIEVAEVEKRLEKHGYSRGYEDGEGAVFFTRKSALFF